MPSMNDLLTAAGAMDLGLIKPGGVDASSVSMIAGAMVLSFMPLSASHLICLLAGALLFLAVQALSPSVSRARLPKGKASPARRAPRLQGASRKLAPPVIARPVARAPLVASPRSEAWRPSVQPVAAPTFAGQGWDAEVQELLAQLTPTAETHEAVARVAQAVRAVVARVLPGAEVTSFVGASLTSGKAFGVAVPEVDVVISAPYAALVRNRWQGRQPGSGCSAQQLRKSAVRACTDRLVSDGGFRFRRSAFRGDEPRVTIVSSPALQSVPMNLSVNALTPLCNAMLIAECTRMDPRTQGLVLLVKRWAKDRGLCHVARGHMSLYSWTVLTVFFLQTGAGGLLPPLAGLETPSGLAVEGQPGFRAPTMTSNALPDLSVGDLFRAFFRFYGSEFDWRAESVSVRSGERGASGALPLLPVHIVVGDDGKTTEVGPSVEDPFDGTKNIGACTTAASLQHLHAARGTEQRRRSSSTQLALTFSRAARPHVLTRRSWHPFLGGRTAEGWRARPQEAGGRSRKQK
ncbi:unnamed protein product [Prorocentrum cordatum]|uniref:PAP-associated domain-containing protein n=1 Tax=Prorocentrum cordatum TaxID=2364126 RepID=A0ABN9WS56_9DINO|nr:unnamed protein product [Polarella glacialis]